MFLLVFKRVGLLLNVDKSNSSSLFVSGDVKIGGNNPISVQSMTNTITEDVEATVNQIKSLENEGADIVRVSCPNTDATKALKEIVNTADIPIVADIHFHYKRALEAADSGAACLRISIIGMNLWEIPAYMFNSTLENKSLSSRILFSEKKLVRNRYEWWCRELY